ncbi:unnamed protein product [Rotaria magnacalcarata]|uniref:PDZ domain-containing protein n=1 Tax=Rotaria magnacalcarata TaxID=392030 RepID=A0A816SIN6_9BILA|nr:unnamed protein product [Rotaria magnacalcarata]CAF2030680.1 unnamed protein product [Rotaria magnacalcarata]CAF2086183.1 unnamed protein product [Rotaria magnacalcarata]CAF3975971.1 unnamed protein product [Rotaria magnacalcarata]CAF3982442.1 unnamed protein product [Rotaria magnacalcarata]
MSVTTGETSLNLEKDIERAIVLLDRLRTKTNATAKATLAAFAASEAHSYPRVIELSKTAEGLAFNVIGAREQNSPIYKSCIIPNGIAWKHGGLKKDDQLLSVNGIFVENEHQKTVDLLKQA